jgi:hypothetical protein
MPEAQSNYDMYLEDLIASKFTRRGYDLAPEIKEEIRKDAARQLDSLIMARAIAALSDREVDQLEGVLRTTRSAEAARDFAAKHIPDFTDFLTEVLMEFRQTYMRN